MRVYVANTGIQGGGGTSGVSVINTSTNTVITTIDTGPETASTAVAPCGAQVYAYVGSSNSIAVINTGTNTITQSIQLGPTTHTPGAISVSPDGNFVYVAALGSYPYNSKVNGSVYVVNTATNKLVKSISLAGEPNDVTFSPDGKSAYVTNLALSEVQIIDTSSYTVKATIGVGQGATGSAVTPDGSLLYVLAIKANNITVINTSTEKVVTTIPTGQRPNGIVLTPDGRYLFVTITFNSALGQQGSPGQIWAYVTSTDTRVSNFAITVGNFPAAIAYAGLLTGCCP
jgi:YVTN family beta-propeller protein